MSDKEWFQGEVVEDWQYERCYWRRVGFAVFAALAAVMLLLPLGGCSSVVFVEDRKPAYDGPPLLAKASNGDSIRLTKEPCPNTSGWLAMSSAEMFYQGKSYKACWVKVGPYVLVFDDNGDVTPLPAGAFEPELTS